MMDGAKFAKKSVSFMKPTCHKCSYTLGQIKFVANPCLQCKQNNYATYYRLVDGRHMGTKTIKMKIHMNKN